MAIRIGKEEIVFYLPKISGMEMESDRESWVQEDCKIFLSKREKTGLFQSGTMAL